MSIKVRTMIVKAGETRPGPSFEVRTADIDEAMRRVRARVVPGVKLRGLNAQRRPGGEVELLAYMEPTNVR